MKVLNIQKGITICKVKNLLLFLSGFLAFSDKNLLFLYCLYKNKGFLQPFEGIFAGFYGFV